MKNWFYKVLILTLLTVFIQSNPLLAQSGWINSMSIIPSQPTTNDQIFVIVNSSYSSGPCGQVVQYVTVLGNLINIQAGHNLGPLAYICSSIDTVPIGQLTAGTYSLHYNISVSGSTIMDSLNFTVIIPVGMNDLNNHLFTIYPNPADEFVRIVTDNDQIIKNTILMDLNGRIIPTKYQLLNTDTYKEIIMDIEDIQNGFYYLHLNSNTNSSVKKLIIQH